MNSKLKVPLIILFFVLLFSGFSNSGNAAMKSDSIPVVKRGNINLKDWDFDNNGEVKLNGEWEFYWRELIEPGGFNRPSNKINYIDVPNFWHKSFVGPNELTGKGHATYHLKIENGRNVDKSLGLYLPFGIESSYKLWVNGKLAATAGEVGISKSKMKGQYLPQVVIIPAVEEVDLVLQVSNYVQRTGGVWDELRYGYADDLIHLKNKRLAEELFVAGSIVIMGMYHLGLYLLRRKDRSPLYFGIFCLLFGFRSLFLGEVYINQLFPTLSFDIYKKIEYLGQYIGPAAFILYVKSLFPQDTHKLPIKILVVVYSILSLIVIAAPASIFTETLPVSHLTLLIYAPYVVYIFIIAAIRKREGALFSCVLFLIMALTVVNDVLYYNQVIHTFDMAKFGLFFFIFAQAFLLSIKFSKAFKSVEALSERQAKWSQELEHTVEQRTEELKATLGNLREAQKQLVESEKMAALGALVAGVAHEINTPVGVSVTATSHLEQRTNEILSVMEQNKMKRSDLVQYLQIANESTQIISTNLRRASELVKSFKQVAVDQSNEDIREFHLRAYIDETLVSLRPHLRQTKIDIQLDCPAELTVYSDPGAFSQIITNLVMNSITHAFERNEEGIIHLNVSKKEHLVIEYSDNGKGMSREVRDKIFDPFFTTNRDRGGTGLGMHIIYNIVTQSLGGTITCQSKLGKGTCFMITVPLNK